jgi:hypothetical protein
MLKQTFLCFTGLEVIGGGIITQPLWHVKYILVVEKDGGQLQLDCGACCFAFCVPLDSISPHVNVAGQGGQNRFLFPLIPFLCLTTMWMRRWTTLVPFSA